MLSHGVRSGFAFPLPCLHIMSYNLSLLQFLVILDIAHKSSLNGIISRHFSCSKLSICSLSNTKIAAFFNVADANHLGINTTYGVYSSYYLAHNHFEGGSPFRYAWVGGLSAAIALAVSPLANYLSRTFTFRAPLILGK